MFLNLFSIVFNSYYCDRYFCQQSVSIERVVQLFITIPISSMLRGDIDFHKVRSSQTMGRQ